MPRSKDPTLAIRERAAALPGVDEGTACTQSSFKAAKKAFLFIGPGAKGVGYKAMFKLDRSLDQAAALAEKHPERFEVGKTGWVTARFSDDAPLAKTVWQKWLTESHALTGAGKPAAKRVVKKKVAKKKANARTRR